MKDLIKIAEGQVDILRDIQTSALNDEEIVVRASSEMRTWCCFIKEIKELEIQKNLFIKQQEKMCKSKKTIL